MKRFTIYMILTLLLLSIPATSARALDVVNRADRYALKLILADAARDKDGNIYVIVNSWTSNEKNLVKISADKTIDRKFRLARMNNCCTVDPFAVDVDKDGNIYILTKQEWINDFVIGKYTPDGELDENFGDEGTLHYPFERPIDIEVRSDGALYVLDMNYPEVYAVAPDGSDMFGFVYEQYSLIKPAKITIGPSDEMYIFDQFDREFSDYDIGQGIVALYPNGEAVFNYGTSWDGINSGYNELIFESAVANQDGTLWVLGTYPGLGSLSGAFQYDSGGNLLEMVSLEERLADRELVGGIIPADEGGFILFEIFNLDLIITRYDTKGKVADKFKAEVFNRGL